MSCSLEPFSRYSGNANWQSKVQGQVTVDWLSDPVLMPSDYYNALYLHLPPLLWDDSPFLSVTARRVVLSSWYCFRPCLYLPHASPGPAQRRRYYYHHTQWCSIRFCPRSNKGTGTVLYITLVILTETINWMSLVMLLYHMTTAGIESVCCTCIHTISLI